MLNSLIAGYPANSDHHSPDRVPTFDSLDSSTKVHSDERSDGNGVNPMANLTFRFIEHEKFDDQTIAAASKAVEESDLSPTFLKCVNYHPRDQITEEEAVDSVPLNAVVDTEDDIDRVLCTDKTPCLVCGNQNKVGGNQSKANENAVNALCTKLCDDTCKSGGVEKDGRIEADKILARSNSNRQQFMANMLNEQKSDDEEDADICCDANIDNPNEPIAPLTVENLKRFNENYFRNKLEIAEALANTSMMTSPAVKRRLAARKIELSMLNNPDYEENAEDVPSRDLLMYLVR